MMWWSGVVAYAFNPSSIQGQHDLQREIQDSQGYVKRPYLRKMNYGMSKQDRYMETVARC